MKRQDDIHPAFLDAEELLRACDVRRLRRSGPGGQHRNKVETAVVLRHRPSGVTAEASERRSQTENQKVALQRLRRNLALQVRRPLDSRSAPSELWKSRCRSGRVLISPRHPDFPALLAEALDTVVDHHLDVVGAARWLGCSTSQLNKLLKAEPQAWVLVNSRRQQAGLHRLK